RARRSRLDRSRPRRGDATHVRRRTPARRAPAQGLAGRVPRPRRRRRHAACSTDRLTGAPMALEPTRLIEMVDAARDSLTVSRVFGEPIERGDTVIIPAAAIRGGGGVGGGAG